MLFSIVLFVVYFFDCIFQCLVRFCRPPLIMLDRCGHGCNPNSDNECPHALDGNAAEVLLYACTTIGRGEQLLLDYGEEAILGRRPGLVAGGANTGGGAIIARSVVALAYASTTDNAQSARIVIVHIACTHACIFCELISSRVLDNVH